MRIDITSPDGNTLVALGIVTKALRRSGVSATEIARIRALVMNARNVQEARDIMEDATNGAIVFFDPRIDE